ncbi:hypothetical protein OAT37_04230 [Alphaproteobacteria bacterium]|nr:hypothetical protein [Alphaproteobacteria bacterium]
MRFNINKFLKSYYNKYFQNIIIFILWMISGFFTALFAFDIDLLGYIVPNKRLILDYQTYIGIGFVCLTIIGLIIIVIESWNNLKNEKSLINKLTDIGKDQKHILIEFYKKKSRFFTRQNLENLNKRIPEMDCDFSSCIIPLIDNKIIIQKQTGDTPSYEITEVIWVKLGQLFPHQDDLILNDKMITFAPYQKVKKALHYFKGVNYKNINNQIVYFVIDIYDDIENYKFLDVQANTIFFEFKKYLKKLNHEISTRCFPNHHNQQTSTIFYDNYDGSYALNNEVNRIIDDCIKNANEAIEQWEKLQSHFDCFERIA